VDALYIPANETAGGKSFDVELNIPFNFVQEKGVSTHNQNKVI